MKNREIIKLIFLYMSLILGAILILAPVVWMLSTSLKDPSHLFDFPPQWIPNPVRWDNYPTALNTMNFAITFRNTVYVTFMEMLGSTVSSLLVAYGFARMRFPGKNFLFMLVLATMMLPGQVTMVPKFILFRILGWIDTFNPLWVPSFFGRPFFIFLLNQFFLTIPKELDEAARIDGCGSFRILTRILLPQLKPALAALTIFGFMGAWNEFMNPLIYINSRAKWTLVLALNAFQSPLEPGAPVTHLIMAASLVVALPCMIVFLLAQKYFIEGVVFSGMKG